MTRTIDAGPRAGVQTGAINFAIERQRHRGFVGRGTLLAQLEQLLVEEPADRWVVVTGGPGMGKSALLWAWLTRRTAAGELVPHHFIRRDYANWDDPASLVSSLVAQFEARFPELPEPEADADLSPVARLAATLDRVSEGALVPRGERLVVLIDGLDEYDPPPGPPSMDPLGAFLPQVAKFRVKDHFGKFYDQIFTRDLSGAQLVSAVLLFRIAENKRRRPPPGAPDFVRYAAGFLAMIMGMHLLADLEVELDQLDHRNFEQARQLIDTKGETYFARAVESVGYALETLYGGQPVSLQRLAATFRRGDLLGYLL